MKKLCMILLAALLLCLPLAVRADGQETPPPPPQEPEYDPLPEEYLSLSQRVLGVWYADGAGLMITLTFAEDGYTLAVPGQEPQAGPWAEQDGQILLDGESALQVLNDALRIDELLFFREQPIVYTPAEIIADAKEGAFDGLWRAQFVAVGSGETAGTMLAQAAEEDAFVYIEGANVALGGARFGNVIKVFAAAPGALTLAEPDLSVKLELQQDGFLRLTLPDAVIYLMPSLIPGTEPKAP